MEEREIASAGSRREARERVLGLLYEADMRDVSLEVLVTELPVPLDGYATVLIDGVAERFVELDEAIESTSHHWSVSRMPTLDRAVLRMGVWELLFSTDVPPGAAISEAVELAAEYSTESSSRFVNGILSRINPDGLAPTNDTRDCDESE